MNHDIRDQSLAELIAGLAQRIPDLLERELRLARAEAAAILDLIVAAIGQLALGSVLAVGAVAVLLAAIVSGIAAILTAIGLNLALAAAAASAMVAGVTGIVAWALLTNAVRTMKAARTSLHDSVDALTFRSPTTSERD